MKKYLFVIIYVSLNLLVFTACNSGKVTPNATSAGAVDSTTLITSPNDTQSESTIAALPFSDGEPTTVKYDSNGKEIWIASYSVSVRSYLTANAIDKDGNIYITADIATIKYDENGKQLWMANDDSDSPRAIAVDNLGNVFVTGDKTTEKYNNKGIAQWAATDLSETQAIAVDNSGNVYVTGTVNGSDIPAVSKYDTNGNRIWIWSAPVAESGGPSAIALDQSGNAYITGYGQTDAGNKHYLTIKLDANGNQVWAETYSGPMNAGDISDDIAVDNQGNVFVTGKSLGIDTSYDYATIKYDSDGNQLWAVRYNDSVNGDDESGLLSLDSKGNVCVTGSSTNGSRNSDYATVKYDTNGNQLWLVRYSGLDNSNNGPTALTVDSSGNVYVTGVSSPVPGTMTYTQGDYDRTVHDYATVKYDTNGRQLWAEIYDNTEGSSWAFGIAVDKSGNVFVTGLSGIRIPVTIP